MAKKGQIFKVYDDDFLKEDEKANFIISENMEYIANNFDINKILVIEKDPNSHNELASEHSHHLIE